MDETSSTCRHTDVQALDSFHFCLSCGSVVTEPGVSPIAELHYKYRPLDSENEQHIRLVRVRSGRKHDDIVCELVHINLAAVRVPAYEAVSYTWATADGDASLSQFIVCHGKRLAVTKNCEAAIRCLRRRDGDRVLWIDAICIDQESTTERNHQVGLMAEVYSKASQVLVYLGFHDPVPMSSVLIYLDKRSRGIITGQPRIERTWVEEFLDHPYFNRVWVLQEISLARLVVVHTDDHSIYWDARTVDELILHCKSISYNPPGVLNWLPATQRDAHDYLDLLHRARHCVATDPRDKIFALYGFLPPCFREAVPVDYATATEEVYTNTAIYIVSTTQRLDILRHVVPSQKLRGGTLPSWVPDWTIRGSLTDKQLRFTSLQQQSLSAYSSLKSISERPPITGLQPKLLGETSDQTEGSPTPDRYSVCHWCGATECHHPALTGTRSGPNNLRLPCLVVRAYRLETVTISGYLDAYGTVHCYEPAYVSQSSIKGPIPTEPICGICSGKRVSAAAYTEFVDNHQSLELHIGSQGAYGPGTSDVRFEREWSPRFGWLDGYSLNNGHFKLGDTV